MSDKDLKVVIVDDFEGISGIDDWHQVMYGCEEFEFGRTQITEDVNAAIRGLRTAGATEIRVVDWHGSGSPNGNLIPEKLEEGVQLTPFGRGPQDSVDESVTAAVLIGFHAMADTQDGFLSHTMGPDSPITVNGKLIGETAYAALILAEYGIPVIMATGDQALVREASTLLPGIETVQVKTSTNRRTTECLPPSEARDLIEEAAASALSRITEFKPLYIEKPIKVEVSYPTNEHADLAEMIPRATRSAEKCVSYIAKDWLEAVGFIRTANRLVGELRTRSLMEELSKLENVPEIRKQFWEKEWEEMASQ